jgi:hypothetical protein
MARLVALSDLPSPISYIAQLVKGQTLMRNIKGREQIE